MRTSRVVVALSVASGLMFTPVAAVSAADAQGGHHSSHAAALPLPGEAFIEGLVRDEHGRLLDDINVEAFQVGDDSGVPVASWLTYESPDSDHPHGFYLLDVPPGAYFVRFSSLDEVEGEEGGHGQHRDQGHHGDDEGYQSQWYANKRAVSIGDQEILILKPVTMERKRADSECHVALVDNVVPAGRHPRVRVRIKSPNSPRVTGSIKVTMNRHKVRTDRLHKLDHGRVVLRLPKRRPGVYRVVVSYAGSNDVKRSHSKVDVLRVVRHGRLPRLSSFNLW